MTNRICWIATPDGPVCVPLLARVELDLHDGKPAVRCVVHRAYSPRSSLAMLTHEASGLSLGALPVGAYLPGHKRSTYKERAQEKMNAHIARQGADFIRATVDDAPVLVKPARTAA